MARTDNLTNYLSDIATAIKTKKGIQKNITANTFDDEILSIQTGISINGISKQYQVDEYDIKIGDFVQVSKILDPTINTYDTKLETFWTETSKFFTMDNYYIFFNPNGTAVVFTINNNLLNVKTTFIFSNQQIMDITQLNNNTFAYIIGTKVYVIIINKDFKITEMSTNLYCPSGYSSLHSSITRIDDIHFAVCNGSWKYNDGVNCDYDIGIQIGKIQDNSIILNTNLYVIGYDFVESQLLYNNNTNELYAFINSNYSNQTLDYIRTYNINFDNLTLSQDNNRVISLSSTPIYRLTSFYIDLSIDKAYIIMAAKNKSNDTIHISAIPVETLKPISSTLVASSSTYDETWGGESAHTNNNRMIVEWCSDNRLARHDVAIFTIQQGLISVNSNFTIPAMENEEADTQGCYIDENNCFVVTPIGTSELETTAINSVTIPCLINKYKGGQIVGVSLTDTKKGNIATIITPTI